MRFRRKQIWGLVLVLLSLLSVVFRSTREAHLLCLRVVFPLKGNTFVQGQPDGCTLYTIPNVQFSEPYRTELMERSGQSADDFALATGSREWSQLKIPSPSGLTNHPLAVWTALMSSYLESSYHTNASEVERSLALVRFAETANQTNGALWLAEAAVKFRAHQDVAAIAALRVAAEKSTWSTGSEKNFQYLSKLYEKAGLSQLDAAIEANFIDSDWQVSMVQSTLKEHLQRLMAQAATSTNDDEFLNLFELLVQLRKAEWAEGSAKNPNGFRYFSPDDDLSKAMGSRMNLMPEASSDYDKQREFQRKAFQDYLVMQTDQKIVSRFLGQADVTQTERKLRREILDGPLFQREMLTMVCTSMSGGCAALFLYLGFTAVLQQLPFLWLRKVGGNRGTWPRSQGFWAGAVLLSVVTIAIGTHFLIALGMFSDVGLIVSDSAERMSPRAQSAVASTIICCSFFVLWLTIWKARKKSIEAWHVISSLVWIYIAAVFAMAYYRFELVHWVTVSV
jgi:hypothetical protein